jgi:trimeric autotransporter adhesin
MSTKTTFKRVALVAVAALGLGVLSVAPSSATVTGVSVTVVNGTAGLNGARSDSSTGAQITISALYDAGTADTMTVQFISAAAVPSGATVRPVIQYLETTSASTAPAVLVNRDAGTTTWTPAYKASDSATAGNNYEVQASAGTAQYVGVKFALYLESISSTNRVAGTYSYSVITKTYTSGVLKDTTVTPAAITITAAASDSKAISPSLSTAFIGSGTTAATADAALSFVSTAASDLANVTVDLKNALGTQGKVVESVTASVSGPGLISFNGTDYGKSITYAYNAETQKVVRIKADGTAGVSTITITTPGGFSATKSLSFYAKAAKTITAAVAQPTLAIGANADAVSVSAVDANGTAWTGAAYIVASTAADALVAGSATTPVACATWNADDGILCPVTAISTGTAKFKVIDAATVALATATSNEVTVTVSAGSPTSVKLAFDKSSYAPFEKALITVTILDKDGKTLQGANRDNMLATGGITSTYAFGSGSDTLTATTINTSKTTGTSTTAGARTYTVYMPAAGDVVISATGGTALPLAGQVKVTATASVVNDGVNAATDAANEATDAANAATDAALAAADAADAATAAAQDASDAVAALSASVSKLISSLRAQITSLTNLVIKIQKKVRA